MTFDDDRRAESLRTLLSSALDYARQRCSPHTGFLHGAGRDLAGATELIAPDENALYSLLLMRSQSAQNILEARRLVGRLLDFQLKGGRAKGCFPRFVHQYPQPGPWNYQMRMFNSLAFQRLFCAKECGSILCSALDRALRSLQQTARSRAAIEGHPDADQAIFELMLWRLMRAWDLRGSIQQISRDEGIHSSSWLRWGSWATGLWIVFLAAFDSERFAKSSRFVSALWPECCDWWAGLESKSPGALAHPGILELALAVQTQSDWRSWPRGPHLLLAGLITRECAFARDRPERALRDFASELDLTGVKSSIAVATTPNFSCHARQIQARGLEMSADFDGAKFLWRGWDLPGCARLQFADARAQFAQLPAIEGESISLQLAMMCSCWRKGEESPLVLLCSKSQNDSWRVENRPATTFAAGQTVCYSDAFARISLRVRNRQTERAWLGHIAPARYDGSFSRDFWRLFIRPLEQNSSFKIELVLTISNCQSNRLF